MGRDIAIRYQIHYVVQQVSKEGLPSLGLRAWTPAEWRIRRRGQIPGQGRPTVENIKRHCLAVEASTQPGGVNAHLGATRILRAWVVDHETGARVDYARSP